MPGDKTNSAKGDVLHYIVSQLIWQIRNDAPQKINQMYKKKCFIETSFYKNQICVIIYNENKLKHHENV